MSGKNRQKTELWILYKTQEDSIWRFSLKKKTVYIPIEIKARELISQTLLAAKIAGFGGRVYLGSKLGIFRILALKPSYGGTLLYKGGTGEGNGFKNFKKSVSKVAILDQEMSPAIQNPKPADRFIRSELESIDRLYYVGSAFASSFFSAMPDIPRSKVKVHGWPRIDLWTPQYLSFWRTETDKLRERFGKFVLFSSDFGILDLADLQWSAEWAKQWNADPDRNFRNKRLQKEGRESIREFRRVVEFLRELDQEPTFPPVLVRPHPSENNSIWAFALRGMKKTRLVYEGDISPFLLASIALLHRGCTTALQAEVLGKPTGVILTEGKSRDSSAAITPFSKSIMTVQDAKTLVSPEYCVPASRPDPSRISSLDGTASEKIATDLLDLGEETESRLDPIWTLLLSRCFWVRWVAMTRGRFSRLLTRQGRPSLPKGVTAKKMPGGVRASEIRQILDRLGMHCVSVRNVPGFREVVCIEVERQV